MSPYPVPALGSFFTGPYGRILLQFGARMEYRQKPFHVFYCVDSYLSGRSPNIAIQRLTSGTSPPPRPWSGVVVVLKTTSATVADYVSVEPSDLADIREFFMHVR